MANYANQKKFYITNVEQITYKPGKEVGNGFYPTLYYDYVDKAAELLNGNAFKLWIYLIRWYNKGFVYFSPAALNSCMGLKKSSIQDSRKELEQKGFLIPQENGDYIFTLISTLLV